SFNRTPSSGNSHSKKPVPIPKQQSSALALSLSEFVPDHCSLAQSHGEPLKTTVRSCSSRKSGYFEETKKWTKFCPTRHPSCVRALTTSVHSAPKSGIRTSTS